VVTVDSSLAPSARDETFMENAIDAIRNKGLKYAGVSVFNVILGQALLIVFYRVLSASDEALPEISRVLRGASANTLAVCISAVPAYYLSRTYVWGKRGRSELLREILPFWVFVLVGLLLSTGGVALVAHFLAAPRSAGFFHPAKLAANVASMTAFGVLWVIRFFWMDKAFHLDHHHAHGPLDVLLDEDEPVEDAEPGSAG
jgi:putative flippase GtrA